MYLLSRYFNLSAYTSISCSCARRTGVEGRRQETVEMIRQRGTYDVLIEHARVLYEYLAIEGLSWIIKDRVQHHAVGRRGSLAV